MPEFHSEPYLHMAGLTHKSALIAWGAFYFRVRDREGDFKLVHDDDLKNVHPPRRESIGARSAPYGDAVVEVSDTAGTLVSTAATSAANHCWVHNLEPDTNYTYRVIVNGEVWAQGQRRDWAVDGDRKGLLPGGEYQNRFRTLPAPTSPLTGSLNFAIIGDFGRGIRKASSETRRQREIAAALETAVNTDQVRFLLTTGDNIYAQKKFLGIPVGDFGDDIPTGSSLFTSRTATSSTGFRSTPASVITTRPNRRNVTIVISCTITSISRERIAADVAAGRASIGPGLFYQFRCGADIEFLASILPKRTFSTSACSCIRITPLSSMRLYAPRTEMPHRAGALFLRTIRRSAPVPRMETRRK